jgi:hypothetical protein
LIPWKKKATNMTTETDLPHLRLLNTGLADSPFRVEVAHLGAVQAQDSFCCGQLLESAKSY